MARVAVVTRLTRREKEALRRLAEQEGRSLSNCVRFLVRRELEDRKLLSRHGEQRGENKR